MKRASERTNPTERERKCVCVCVPLKSVTWPPDTRGTKENITPRGDRGQEGTKIGNRVEDGNRAKNWVVQTSTVAVYSSFPLSSLSPVPLYSAFSSSVFDFIPFCNLGKMTFLRLRVVVFFSSSNHVHRLDIFLSFFLPLHGRGFVSPERKKQTADFLFYSVRVDESL